MVLKILEISPNIKWEIPCFPMISQPRTKKVSVKGMHLMILEMFKVKKWVIQCFLTMKIYQKSTKAMKNHKTIKRMPQEAKKMRLTLINLMISNRKK